MATRGASGSRRYALGAFAQSGASRRVAGIGLGAARRCEPAEVSALEQRHLAAIRIAHSNTEDLDARVRCRDGLDGAGDIVVARATDTRSDGVRERVGAAVGDYENRPACPDS